MALSINTNTDAIKIHGLLVNSSKSLSESLTKLSSGKRINSAKDDAAGYSVANKFKSDISAMKVAYRNASEGESMLSVADGAYNKINDIVTRMKELATQAASDQTPQAPLQSEFQALQSEIDRIANSTKYNARKLIDGSSNCITFQIGQSNGIDYQLAIGLLSAKSSDLGIPGSGVNAVKIDSVATAQSAMDLLDTALSSINAYMSTVGAYQNRLEYAMDNLSITIENFSASESTIRDVDMASEVTNYTKNQILQQSGMSMLAQANAAPQQILTLLKG
jgi:flagellin